MNYSNRLPELHPGSVSIVPKGTAFTRYAMALAAAKGDSHKALRIADAWRDTPEVATILRATFAAGGTDISTWRDNPRAVESLQKAAVAAGDTSDSGWAAPLSTYDHMAGEFLDVLRPATIIGRIAGLARVPFNVRMARGTSGTSANWVGQSAPKPVSAMSLDSITLATTKISAIAVITAELAQFSSPSAVETVQRDLIAALAQKSDSAFIDPTLTAVAGVSPASITSGVSARGSTGSSVAQIDADVRAALAAGIAAGLSYQTGVWIVHPRTALYLSGVLTAGNAPMWPTISVRGGTWYGLPVITSASVPIDTGSDTYIVLLDAANILLAQGGVDLSVTRQASLQMDSAPSAGAASQVSLWQNNLVGLRAEEYVNWERKHDAAVAVIADVSY